MRSHLVILSVVIAVACSNPVSPGSNLLVETAVSTTTIHPGELTTVTVVVTNHGRRSSTIDIGCGELFTVHGANGAVVGPAARFCTLLAQSMNITPGSELAPGESATFTTEWSGDALSGEVTALPPRLPAGTYQLRGRVGVRGGGFVEGTAVAIQIVD